MSCRFFMSRGTLDIKTPLSPPHFHAVYGEYNALVSIETLGIIEGDLPSRAQKLVIEWATLYQQDLLTMWNSQEICKLPPLK